MREKIKFLKKGENNFPKNLEALEDCPDILFVMGNEKILNDFSIAVIGARKCTIEGRIIAEDISKELTKANINIISGLALGIDSIAHETCVKNNGKTIAVLGGGFYNLYPKENKKLVNEIIDTGGVVISEYPPDEVPRGLNFKKRNRIIAAISSGVVVIEAKEKSGSLSTVNYARKLEKNIFVVPGNVRDENYKRKQ